MSKFIFSIPCCRRFPLSSFTDLRLQSAARFTQPRSVFPRSHWQDCSSTSYATNSNDSKSPLRAPHMSRSSSHGEAKKMPALPRPSSSVILVSPQNEILLLHRVKTSTSFASAHVFPGGNLSEQDGPCPPPENLSRHEDGPHYRRAALRELFEESGILLAKDRKSGKMLAVDEATREQGRKLIHQGKATFDEWLAQQHPDAEPDTEKLTPFTRWITPSANAKRYTTQMYIYFMPLPVNVDESLLKELPQEGEREEIQVPSSDGGIEVTEAQFLPAKEWLRRAQNGEIILFPPQFLLLYLVSGFLDQHPRTGLSVEEMEHRRNKLIRFIHSGSPAWTDKCISPKMTKVAADGRTVLALHDPGYELKGSKRQGESDYVVLVRFMKGSAREVTVALKKDILKDERSNL